MGHFEPVLHKLMSVKPEPALPTGKTRMYAIAFDLDTKLLEQHYPGNSWQNAYAAIRAELEPKGFTWRQGSVYFGNDDIDAVKCVLAIQQVSAKLTWLKPSVKDIRMLRIEEFNDLSAAL